jgi:hypothetical protein
MKIQGTLKSVHTSAKDEDGIPIAVSRITIEIRGYEPNLAELCRQVGREVRATLEPTQFVLPPRGR